MADEMMIMRFIRPIYDAIDNRQYKNAIKLCNQKKVCDIDLVQVLQAHCLERIGKVDDALRIVRRIALKKPTEETILSTMQLVFKLCGAANEMLPVYENAAAVQPLNEEVQAQLFQTYARSLLLPKQQQLGFKMYKAFNKLQYVGWACLSMLLQVTIEKSLPMKMLPLADKMLAKALRDHPSEANGEAVSLLVLLLQAQGKANEAMDAFTEFIHVLDTDDAVTTKPRALEGDGVPEDEIELGPMQAIDRLVLEAGLAKDVGDLERCAAVYKTLLTKYNADDWAFWLGYIESAKSPEIVLPVITSLQKEHGSRLRGPHLAEIELHFQQAAPADTLLPLLLGYMERFASKSCCFTDLQRYFSTLPSGARTALVASISTALSTTLTATDIPGATLEFRKSLLSRKTLRFLGEDARLPPSDLIAKANAYLAEYEAAQWLNEAKVGGQREVQVTDDLLLLAVHLLLDAYHVQSSIDLLVQAAAALELGLRRSAYNFQMKMLLCRVYALLGAGDAVLHRYKELDVKQIQLDSLSHLVLDGLFGLHMDKDGLRLCEAIRNLHKTTARDTPEFIGRAYRLGVYSKAQDMTSFLLSKMRVSEMLALATAELAHAQLLTACSSATYLHGHLGDPSLQTELDELLSPEKTLSANHHREVEVTWTAPIKTDGAYLFAAAGVSSCDRTRDSTSLRAWLELRAVVPKLLAAALDASPETATYIATLQRLLSVLSDPSMTAEWQLVAEASHALEAVVASDLPRAKAALDRLALVIPTVTTLQLQAVDGVVAAHALSKASIFLRDVVPYSSMLLSVAMKLLKPKKKTKDPVQKDVSELLRQLVLKMTTLLTAGDKALRQVHVRVDGDAAVKDKVESAQKATLERLSKTIADRVAFLRSL
ncbi:hypothetical protein SPRG_19998 [Saprolegnia parasitica CBS 223.65]|uniref:Uncharacterized protein n=1 Tax=Saprolegnia parasitica (strain CBS 223.65) TaxID=695850 RepID=A0A067CHZ0_SAPPC|nr:hypothetical protein SPRG_19998 [Saprolegnia parasitica CBS 223.65]KDO28790.1 hypothetical protein SPRG_19998 [Saprolegnia parasitica CBS 223.65]|eukprot:XP_012200528.1 hypothetical protein SPRG_19998 [Saprolegnia parasitica CBS 223.65]